MNPTSVPQRRNSLLERNVEDPRGRRIRRRRLMRVIIRAEFQNEVKYYDNNNNNPPPQKNNPPPPPHQSTLSTT